MRLAIVGSGVSGLTCAHLLGPEHEVTLYEADFRLGGHTNTVTVDDPDGPIQVDTGFIVFNDRNYPNFVRLLDDLGVAGQDSEMSFSVTDRSDGFTYRATNPNSLLARRRNLIDPRLWRLVYDIARFHRDGRRYLAELDHRAGSDGPNDQPHEGRSEPGHDELEPVRRFLDRGRYSETFERLHMQPMVSAIWSATVDDFDRYPTRTLLRFLDNHGLLSVGDRPQWRTVTGGSARYVDAIVSRFRGRILRSSPVTAVRRGPDGVDVTTSGPSGTDRYDRVILACHSDQALRMLADRSPAEERLLAAIRYQPNEAVLHTDVSVMPPSRRAWAAWNCETADDRPDARASLTYDLTNLQRLAGRRRQLVSLNTQHSIDPSTVNGTFDYAHPVFDRAAVEAQADHDAIDGADRVHFCGAYWGYGFHEDGVVSALRVCRKLGLDVAIERPAATRS